MTFRHTVDLLLVLAIVGAFGLAAIAAGRLLLLALHLKKRVAAMADNPLVGRLEAAAADAERLKAAAQAAPELLAAARTAIADIRANVPRIPRPVILVLMGLRRELRTLRSVLG